MRRMGVERGDGLNTLIKFYDKDVLKNISATISLKPDKVIFFYDSEIKDMTFFFGLRKCFVRHKPDIILEYYPVDIRNMEGIYQRITEVVKTQEHNRMELSGGSELMLIAGYRAGVDMGMEILYTDLTSGTLMDLQGNHTSYRTEPLRLEDFVDARCAEFIGNSHEFPSEDRYADIVEMCYILFRNLGKWKDTCNFFQTVVSGFSPHEVQIQSRRNIIQKNGRHVAPSPPLLMAFQKHGFIKNLKLTEQNVRFTFTSLLAKQYAIGYGVWLELLVYIKAKETGVFEDVRLGMMIDWDAYDGVTVAGNEFDVVLSDRSMPVFISCKLREADTAALNELLIGKKRIGGWFSKGVIVTFGREKQLKTGTYKRARELGIALLDAGDVMSPDFGDRLVKAIREQDLVSLKWKKV